MNTCKTCKHWKFDKDARDAYRVSDYCAPMDPDEYKPMVMPFEVRECTHPSKTFCERPVEKNGFGVADGSQFMAVLVTGEDFGCVRHEGDPCPFCLGDPRIGRVVTTCEDCMGSGLKQAA